MPRRAPPLSRRARRPPHAPPPAGGVSGKASFACSPVFAATGCKRCLRFLGSPAALAAHACPFAHASASAAPRPAPPARSENGSGCDDDAAAPPSSRPLPPPRSLPRPAVALDCEMAAVLCGDGAVRDACVRVCVVDERESVLYHSLVSPGGTVVDYRTAFTGLVAGDLDGAPPLAVVRERVAAILSGEGGSGSGNGSGSGSGTGGCDAPPSPRLLVGHGLDKDLAVLHLSHPAALRRDTALLPSLQRATTGKAHKLRDLVGLHLGYAIQAPGCAHDPEEDAVGAMRLYRRVKLMRAAHAAAEARDAAALVRAGGGNGWARAAAAAAGGGGGGGASPPPPPPPATGGGAAPLAPSMQQPKQQAPPCTPAQRAKAGGSGGGGAPPCWCHDEPLPEDADGW